MLLALPDPMPWQELHSLLEPYRSNALETAHLHSVWRPSMTVTTGPPHTAAVYDLFAREVPDLKIRPGLATFKFLDSDFDNASAWQALAEEIKLAVARTGSDTCILEHEWAMRTIMTGQQVVDLSRLAQSLKALPNCIRYIWYPGLGFSDEPDKYARVKAIVEVVASNLPGVIFTSFVFQGRYNPTYWATAKLREDEQAMGLSVIPICYFDCQPANPDRMWDWRDSDINDLRQRVADYPPAQKTGELFVYPINRCRDNARNLARWHVQKTEAALAAACARGDGLQLRANDLQGRIDRAVAVLKE